jgi:hypothetical protein
MISRATDGHGKLFAHVGLNIKEIVDQQQGFTECILSTPWIHHFWSVLLRSNRTPFDLPEPKVNWSRLSYRIQLNEAVS